MRRPPALLLLCLLAFATGVACLRAAALVTPPSIAPPSTNVVAATNVALVARFFTALNTALRTGHTSELESIIAEDMIDHPAQLNGSAGRVGLVQDIGALRDLSPDLQVVIDDLQATNANQVTARVHATGAEPGHFLGLPVPAGFAMWPPAAL